MARFSTLHSAPFLHSFGKITSLKPFTVEYNNFSLILDWPGEEFRLNQFVRFSGKMNGSVLVPDFVLSLDGVDIALIERVCKKIKETKL